MTNVLSVRDLKVSFASEAGRVDAVRGVSFDLEAGKTLGIVGESGSGKSVTSLAIMGLLDENAKVTGSIMYDGQELVGMTDKQLSVIRGNGMSMVFQDPLTSLTPVYTVGDQLIEALTVHRGLSKKDAWDRSVELLKLVGITEPERRMKSFPHEFSGGMRQRVVIAIAMANNPKLIICDEPTTALDVTIQAQILDLIEKAQDETGAAVIMITHDMGVVARTADDVLVMYAGKPVEHAPVRELFHKTRMPYSIGLLGAIPRVDKAEKEPLTPIKGNPPLLIDLPDACPFADRCPIVMDACRAKEPELLPVPTGSGDLHQAACIRAHEIEDGGLLGGLPVYPVRPVPESDLTRSPREERPITLEVKNLRKTFPLLKGAFLKRKVGEVQAIKGISFDVREGETMAIVGESGSGKTTTLLQIMDMVKQTDGDIVIAGTSVNDIHSRKVERALRRDIQIVFQDPMGALDPRMTVADIISEPLFAIGTPKEEAHRRVDELMDLVGLNPAHSDRFPQAFSGGQRQRIGIARALSTNPKIVVLDEPVSALDVSIQAGVINLLDELKTKLGLSYLFVAHDLSVVRHIADRVAVMYLGEFVEHGDVDQVFDDPQHPYTKALLSAIPVPDPDIERTRERVVFDADTMSTKPASV
ncbi:ABC transporter ATP-binding protein [Microbacterium sp. p3-SID338]|uniref:ABC transporter ATP-binding protein n=1 Tax=unclassified Microbacterium TaxID=2609290 RepID=UPI0007882C13|nr:MULTISPECIES: ABC transporter ATP-binding protein [unclassified Microbacterium]KYJ98906.1 peptide ABC transporter ATP-binding protein [Microbacterium sp. CH1]MCT1396224.1 ABC transporter ATP-binding protein [Microbacterium sp. p3-SID338]PMC02350.1 ABC transporter ATP-binding protein [Microbacterium sp. UMB0228]